MTNYSNFLQKTHLKFCGKILKFLLIFYVFIELLVCVTLFLRIFEFCQIYFLFSHFGGWRKKVQKIFRITLWQRILRIRAIIDAFLVPHQCSMQLRISAICLTGCLASPIPWPVCLCTTLLT